MTHPNQGAVPPIDREAETLEPTMPTAENAPPCVFTPGNGITTTDVIEIAIMFLLQLSGGTKEFTKGALRSQVMSAERVGLLSASAERWMKPVGEPTT